MWSSDRLGFVRRALRRAVAVATITVMAGCGFHLRGDVTYAFRTLYLNAPPANPMTAELKRAIQGAAGARLVDAPTDADVVLDVTGLVDDKQVLSLSGGGRVREFLLVKRATIAVHDSSGRDWLPASEVQVRRSYTFNEAEVLAREAQEVRLLKEMQTDVVQQIVRRLQAAHAPT